MTHYPPPAMRKLRVYAFDPQAATQLDTARISHATIQIPWEERWEAKMRPGPVNEYFEVIDIDPGSGQFYDPVDLNDPHLLAQDGLKPSEGDPRFHQQMVFAVAMKTVKLFERALGRKVYWCPQWDVKADTYRKVRKLRIYPHGLREANAYYSKEKKALLFGYFKASMTDPGVNLPGSWVFTALSHDIIAHETTHAILDGLHRRYSESTSADSLAFHEAFADIVALLMHFMLPEAVTQHVAANGGNLSQRSWMSGLARQFGEATGGYAALREAIDDKDSQQLPDPTLLSRTWGAPCPWRDPGGRGVRCVHRYLRAALGGPAASGRRSGPQRQSSAAGAGAAVDPRGDQIGGPCAAHVHSGAGLPAADRRALRRVFASDRHGRHRPHRGRSDAVPTGDDPGVPPSRHTAR